MTRNEIKEAREKVLAKMLLLRFRSRLGDVTVPELAELFEMEELAAAAKFRTYAAFAIWLKKLPAVSVVSEAVGKRSVMVLQLDARAADFVERVSGETTKTFEFMPIGDFSYCTEAEVAP